jgi:hypothetical protein
VYFGICEPAKAAKRQIARLASSSVLFALATTYSLIERELITRKTGRRTSKQIEVLPEHVRPHDRRKGLKPVDCPRPLSFILDDMAPQTLLGTVADDIDGIRRRMGGTQKLQKVTGAVHEK